MSVSSARARKFGDQSGWVSSQVRLLVLAGTSERRPLGSGSADHFQRNRLIADALAATSRRSVNNFNLPRRPRRGWPGFHAAPPAPPPAHRSGSDLPRLRADPAGLGHQLQYPHRLLTGEAASRSRSRRADMLRQSSMPQTRGLTVHGPHDGCACPAVVALDGSHRPTFVWVRRKGVAGSASNLNNNHGGCLHLEGVLVLAGRRIISVGAKATLLSSHAGRSFTSAARLAQRQPQEDGRRKSEPDTR